MLVYVFRSSVAFAANDGSDDDWHGAHWIWDSVSSAVAYTHDLWLMIHKTIELDKELDSTVAKISIDSRY
ncbi:MAG: hypothetical protein FWH55_09765 [Oscillospiraceae bacterium]|nr:hypothetical protein [Oscillospiraceae bacterium]